MLSRLWRVQIVEHLRHRLLPSRSFQVQTRLVQLKQLRSIELRCCFIRKYRAAALGIAWAQYIPTSLMEDDLRLGLEKPFWTKRVQCNKRRYRFLCVEIQSALIAANGLVCEI